MNKTAYTAFVAFWAAVATMLIVSGLSPQAQADQDKDELPLITMEELAKHDNKDSCWKAIHGKVYDVTDYIPDHPTPPSIMYEWCGRESTEAYDTKGYGRPHSKAADAMLKDMLVGRLKAED
ncbi:cytochrome b5 domain-containing protein [Natronospira bacteriovora]|uniref:Cytochrome b5-like heme/steroid binding domain-containing protein n=1 Tax=Natronospira bacteriovora TaxID=3069753 RepID=A0ABU0W479_9GAMM|nr:cytochrome b5-like heme/steroid binding domain-containing protein [Natronospira sp. AB-CW4]MDQ2068824.1 cytochrome b5-like heme/steroid binding domain-containing protein [Natronospira sp. AB-CW4]